VNLQIKSLKCWVMGLREETTTPRPIAKLTSAGVISLLTRLAVDFSLDETRNRIGVSASERASDAATVQLEQAPPAHALPRRNVFSRGEKGVSPVTCGHDIVDCGTFGRAPCCTSRLRVVDGYARRHDARGSCFTSARNHDDAHSREPINASVAFRRPCFFDKNLC